MMIRSRRTLGVDMNVVAKRGGSGAKAHAYAMGKPKDGYTILALTQSHLYTIVSVGALHFCEASLRSPSTTWSASPAPWTIPPSSQ